MTEPRDPLADLVEVLRDLVAELRADRLRPERPPLERFVKAQDVVEQLGVPMSTAYDMLRKAAGRKPHQRGVLRVSATRWRAFLEATTGADAVRSPPRRKAPPRAVPATPRAHDDGPPTVRPIQPGRPQRRVEWEPPPGHTVISGPLNLPVECYVRGKKKT